MTGAEAAGFAAAAIGAGVLVGCLIVLLSYLR